jgi:protein-L-isoaspartate(D-aspartate) O-methyltransferase
MTPETSAHHAAARAWFAEDIRVVCNIRQADVIAALAAVPREQFLGQGPWQIMTDMSAGPRMTDDADPARVYHNIAIAIDPGKNLYNGQPGLIARWLDAVAIRRGERVIHIGSGTGYFTALLAHLVGPAGSVTAMDVNAELVERARTNLAPWPWVSVHHGDGRHGLPSGADVVLVHAGASHLLDEWLDALRDGGRLHVPLTCSVPGMPPGISKGATLLASRRGADWTASVSSVLAIYSLVGIRDEDLARKLGTALMANTAGHVTSLRRDPHDEEPSCWLHAWNVCVSKQASVTRDS